ncbi:MAG: flagellar biosynthesis protein FliQ [Gemmatimonadales bacterium]|jgi:flagellar biosynthetic protein FliQ|nr:flagellar biosynthesis protein FliQ [Gemmatimonadales bacterium]MDZ4257315.1 flagellar biosynthesis protein FliQ [Gemmatimonadales bacterium]MDZ4388950.1 flagellar biosynthesis protein FliQ [Gemmatimonadales bacterium]PKL93956.1 MAG: flagellar biosynthetic protein FliQ [Gemmatimonadetes bacterium HGW-Gemmatimonadetes-1]
MTGAAVVELMQRALTVALTVGGPLLIVALVVGILVSLVQAVTQVQEQSLTFVPKLLAVALVFLVTLPWMLRGMVSFTVQLLRSLPGAAR